MDGDGRRVKSIISGETTLFVGAHYEVTNGVVTKYYFAGAQRIAMRKNGTLSYMLTDHLGSTSITTNASGAMTSQMKFKAWGEVRFASGTNPAKYTYTGQYSNVSDFGLMFYNARWYDPVSGRFSQADTIVPAGVQGLDRYAYVNNSPLNYVDPGGHRPACSGADADPGCRSRNNTNQQNAKSSNPAIEMVMSLLGFSSLVEYTVWAHNNPVLADQLLSAEAGDIFSFTYTDPSGNPARNDWVIMKYGDGYTFYSLEDRARVDASMPDFANVVSSMIVESAVFGKNSEGGYVAEKATSGFATQYPPILDKGWDKPVDGGIVIPSTSPAEAMMLYGSVAITLYTKPFAAPIIFLGGASATIGTALTIEIAPLYKDSPYGP